MNKRRRRIGRENPLEEGKRRKRHGKGWIEVKDMI